MPPKRKGTDDLQSGPTGREKKKQKMAHARTIAVQAVPRVSFTGAAIAGPSKGPGSTDTSSMKGLPGAIDVEKFAEARAFEINAMQNAIKTASSSATHRAWQTLPRHLRRRAASHNPRRVPLRLRDKARAEMDPVRKKALGRSKPKLGKNRRISRTEEFSKRQRDKIWLETHLWHAKRMHMENMWGYSLAVKPTEKAFRPSYRAAVHDAIVHDASYFALIELQGPEATLISILEACCDPQGAGPGSKRFTTGVRTLETHIYKLTSYPFDLIAPITVIWRPTTPLPVVIGEVDSALDVSQPDPAESSEPGSQTKQRKRPRKKKQDQNDSSTDGTSSTIWIRCHPAVFDEVFATLQSSASHTLEAAQKAAAGKEFKDIDVEIADLRGQINVFEIMGPKSSQVIKGTLRPVGQDQREEFKKFWSSLTDLQTSGSVPRGMIIGFKVYDPRLNFPPKNAKPALPGSGHVPPATPSFPAPVLAQSEIWDESVRCQLKKPRYKKKDLDERRSKLLIPGTALTPIRQDDRIPVLLIQRSIEVPNSGDKGLHGWTIILPAGWSMAFFTSLIHTGTRVGGQRERQTQGFEAGTSYFPRDYPSTTLYEKYAKKRQVEERAAWARKPPAKRTNYKKLGTRSPWRADWEVVLGLVAAKESDESEESEEALVSTQREAPPTELNGDMDTEESTACPWLLRGTELGTILTSISMQFNHTSGLLEAINKLRKKRAMVPLEVSTKDNLLKGALVPIKVTLCTRGAPGDLAAIYSIEDDEVRIWNKGLQKAKLSNADLFDEPTPDELKFPNTVPPPSQIIGYVTSGNFSLSRGEGYAVGAIPLKRLLDLRHQADRLYPPTRQPPLLVKIHDREGQRCRAAHIELLCN